MASQHPRSAVGSDAQSVAEGGIARRLVGAIRGRFLSRSPTLEELNERASLLAEAEAWTHELAAFSESILRVDPSNLNASVWQGRCAAQAADDEKLRASFRSALVIVEEPSAKRGVLTEYLAAKRDLAAARRQRESDANRASLAAHQRFPGQSRPLPGTADYRREREAGYRLALASWEALHKPTSPATRSCPRCGGVGWIPRFSHVDGGISFRCHGRGY